MPTKETVRGLLGGTHRGIIGGIRSLLSGKKVGGGNKPPKRAASKYELAGHDVKRRPSNTTIANNAPKWNMGTPNTRVGREDYSELTPHAGIAAHARAQQRAEHAEHQAGHAYSQAGRVMTGAELRHPSVSEGAGNIRSGGPRLPRGAHMAEARSAPSFKPTPPMSEGMGNQPKSYERRVHPKPTTSGGASSASTPGVAHDFTNSPPTPKPSHEFTSPTPSKPTKRPPIRGYKGKMVKVSGDYSAFPRSKSMSGILKYINVEKGGIVEYVEELVKAGKLHRRLRPVRASGKDLGGRVSGSTYHKVAPAVSPRSKHPKKGATPHVGGKDSHSHRTSKKGLHKGTKYDNELKRYDHDPEHGIDDCEGMEIPPYEPERSRGYYGRKKKNPKGTPNRAYHFDSDE